MVEQWPLDAKALITSRTVVSNYAAVEHTPSQSGMERCINSLPMRNGDLIAAVWARDLSLRR